jgi:hypothetical protein
MGQIGSKPLDLPECSPAGLIHPTNKVRQEFIFALRFQDEANH